MLNVALYSVCTIVESEVFVANKILIETTVRLKSCIRQKIVERNISVMTPVSFWRFTGTPTTNGVVTVGNNETTLLRPDSLLGKFRRRARVG